MPINDELKQAVRERANYICEYCHSPERLSANRFTIDHIIPSNDDGINGEGLFGFDGMKGRAEMVDGLGVLKNGLPLVGNNGKKIGGFWGGCTVVVHLGEWGFGG